jgi:hypothetical protein
MKLCELMRHSKDIAKEAELHDFDDQLMGLWNMIHLHASFLAPHNKTEVKFLRERIEEYAEFIAEGPVNDFDALQAQGAINRMHKNIAEWCIAQSVKLAAA